MAHLLLPPIIMDTTPAAMDVVPLTGLSLFQYNDRTRPLSIKHAVCHTKDPRKSSAHYCSTFAYFFSHSLHLSTNILQQLTPYRWND